MVKALSNFVLKIVVGGAAGVVELMSGQAWQTSDQAAQGAPFAARADLATLLYSSGMELIC